MRDSQPPRSIPGYLRSERRTPLDPPVTRMPTILDATGPAWDPSTVATEEHDLSVLSPGRPRALGQLIVLEARVVDARGRPLPHLRIEMWQANAAGKYIHKNDPSPVPVDPNFRGLGRATTDAEGRFRFRTIKPGGYAVPYEGSGSAADWWRPPHLHLSIFGPAMANRLVTQMYFPGEPLNAHDLLLNSIPDPAARDRLVGHYTPALNTADGALGFTHTLVLGGPRDTPFDTRR